MARKNLLKGLMDEAAKPDGDAAEKQSLNAGVDTEMPKRRTGAIGAVSRSIAELKSRSVVDLDPHDIKAGGVTDRLEHDEADHKQLMNSLGTYGQQVPILVRPDPEEDGKYQVVYGRRRVLAMRDLGQPIKAMIRDLDDAELVMAQGQENTARRDLSFIERVNFARQMLEAGYDRKVICDALSTDKTLISRMIYVSDAIPTELIEMIGAAPGTGRDRWLTFAKLWTVQDHSIEDARAMIAVAGQGDTSDGRFAALMDWLQRHAGGKKRAVIKAPAPLPLLGADGQTLGRAVRQGKTLRLELDTQKTDGFETWLSENLNEIHRDWLKRQSGE